MPRFDRRTGSDRRQVDQDPLGKRDRRRLIEARRPEVVELDLSASDWAALTEEPPPQPRE